MLVGLVYVALYDAIAKSYLPWEKAGCGLGESSWLELLCFFLGHCEVRVMDLRIKA